MKTTANPPSDSERDSASHPRLVRSLRFWDRVVWGAVAAMLVSIPVSDFTDKWVAAVAPIAAIIAFFANVRWINLKEKQIRANAKGDSSAVAD